MVGFAVPKELSGEAQQLAVWIYDMFGMGKGVWEQVSNDVERALDQYRRNFFRRELASGRGPWRAELRPVGRSSRQCSALL